MTRVTTLDDRIREFCWRTGASPESVDGLLAPLQAELARANAELLAGHEGCQAEQRAIHEREEWDALMAEAEKLRAENVLLRKLRDVHRGNWLAEQAKLNALEKVKIWINEDGKRFAFVDDIADALSWTWLKDSSAPDVTQNAGEEKPRYRVGHSLGRTVYDGDDLIGLMDTVELGQLVVLALNGGEKLRDALAEVFDQRLADLRTEFDRQVAGRVREELARTRASEVSPSSGHQGSSQPAPTSSQKWEQDERGRELPAESAVAEPPGPLLDPVVSEVTEALGYGSTSTKGGIIGG